MTAEQEDRLRAYVAELEAFERSLEASLNRQRDTLRQDPEAAEAVKRAVDIAKQHQSTLAEYLGERGKHANADPLSALFSASQRYPSATLRIDYAALAYGMAGYVVLFEMALRLYDPRLREIAPKHLKEYASAAYAISQLIPERVARELANEGLECQCICPMCGLGACGCVALGRQSIETAHREAAAVSAGGDGFPLQAPRARSPLALAGVQRGDRLLAVDDHEARSLLEIQAAIRKHTIGEEVLLRFQRGTGPPWEVRAKHMSDYPKK